MTAWRDMKSGPGTAIPRAVRCVAAGPILLLISAPSGGGKTTVCEQLLAARPELWKAVTCTTRPARPGEREGIDYFFLEAAEFEERLSGGALLEHATVYGHSYGTPKGEILAHLRAGRDVLLNVDVQGAASIRQRIGKEPELERALVTVFLTPPTLGILEQRLRRRGTDSAEVIARRLGVAREEIARWNEFDYLVISTTIQEDLRRMLLILEAEKMRTPRAPPPEL